MFARFWNFIALHSSSVDQAGVVPTVSPTSSIVPSTASMVPPPTPFPTPEFTQTDFMTEYPTPDDAENMEICKNICDDKRYTCEDVRFLSRHNDAFFLVRMVDAPGEPLPLPNHSLLIGKPSPDWQQEKLLIEESRLTHIVCRNSGGPGAYAKIRAARELGMPVIMVQR